MGFYGNITNTSKIQFVFDKTYQNRKQMEENMETDNVYIGRYVLVDYDLNFPGKNYNRLYRYSDNQFYFSPGWEQATRAKSSSEPYYLKDEDGTIIGINTVEIGPYTLYDEEPVYVWDEDKQIEVYYQALYIEGSEYPKFELINSPSGAIASTNFYYGNYMIDKEYYGDAAIGRGWDSTVWQKVYTDDKEKYVMIAELNSVVPTFDLAIDQPTLNPMTPHFDSDSSSLYYRLHVQPNWGFRVANYDDLSETDKKKYGSDTRVDNSGWNYDSNLKRMQMDVQRYNGAIYFNKDGFDPDYRKIKDSSNDEISMKPTGSSGLQYYDRHGTYMNSNSTSAKNDIQELFINLPSIGDTVSEMWDKVYGQGIITPEENVYRRNTSMEWDTYAGERLVKETSGGTGYEFTPEQTASIAGVVNSVHDLMGMVLIEDDNIKAENALMDHIYYRTKENSSDKGFFIKDLTYVYEESDVPEKREKVELKDFDDPSQRYYYKKRKNYYLADKYQTGAQYFSLSSQQISKQPLAEYEYKPNTYYYKDVNGSYVLATEENPRQTRDYYVVPDWEEQGIPSVDNKYTFFYPTDTTYYNNFFKGNYDEANKKGNGLFTIGTDGNLIPFVIEEDDGYIKDLYWWQNYIVTTEIDVNGKEVEVFVQDSGTSTKLTMIKFQPNVYFSLKENSNADIEDQNYVILKNQASIAPQTCYYTFPEGKEPVQITGRLSGNSQRTYFYEPSKYYYLEGDDYVFAEEKLKLNRIYYNLNINDEEALITDKFYEPNKYYYQDDEKWILDNNDRITNSREYYNIYTQYVIDGAGKFNAGEKWNPSIEKPDDVKLGLRKEQYQWKELEGFARKLNTIHGLIIKINQIMKFGDRLTRDTSTVQGCINQLNDIIIRFDDLVPNQIALVNEYGKITSGPSFDDQWIGFNTEGGQITINHHGPVAGTVEAISDETPAFGATFTITDNYFDEKGHCFDTKNHTVKIPEGSLNDEVSNGSDVITQLNFVKSTGALTTTRSNIADINISNNKTLGVKINDIEKDISNEIKNRQDAISNEATARQSAISNEATARQNADNGLQDSINTEKAEREKLNGRVSTLENKTISWNDVQEKPGNFVLLNTTFSYKIGEENSSMTIQGLFDYISQLEQRIKALEDASSAE